MPGTNHDCIGGLSFPPAAGYRIDIRLGEGAVTALELVPAHTPLTPATDMALLNRVADYFRRYFRGERGEADFALAPQGTPYQLRVWRALQAIPYGQTRTYGELALSLHSSARAVAGACRANPIPLLIPCHRVVARDGLGGYMGEEQGEMVHIKQWLLAHEGDR